MTSRYEDLSWDDLVGPDRTVSHAEVRDAALASMGDGKRVPVRPARTAQYVDAPELLADVQRTLGLA